MYKYLEQLWHEACKMVHRFEEAVRQSFEVHHKCTSFIKIPRNVKSDNPGLSMDLSTLDLLKNLDLSPVKTFCSEDIHYVNDFKTGKIKINKFVKYILSIKNKKTVHSALESSLKQRINDNNSDYEYDDDDDEDDDMNDKIDPQRLIEEWKKDNRFIDIEIDNEEWPKDNNFKVRGWNEYLSANTNKKHKISLQFNDPHNNAITKKFNEENDDSRAQRHAATLMDMFVPRNIEKKSKNKKRQMKKQTRSYSKR